MDVFVGLLLWAGSVWAGVEIGKDKGRFGEGLVLTIILGPIGLLILFALPPTQDAAPRHHTPVVVVTQPAQLAASAPAPQKPSGSVSERLTALDDLRRQGLITEDEAQARRGEILKDL